MERGGGFSITPRPKQKGDTMSKGIVLEEMRKKTEIVLPKSGATVWLWDDILAGDVLGGMQFNNLGQVEKTDTFAVVLSVIADWNFIDSEGNKVPVNVENVQKLSMTDFNVLAQHVAKVSQQETIGTEEKKS
jgi:hypothetical protein